MKFHIMKTSTKIILATVFVGTLAIAGLARNVDAQQPQSQVAVIKQQSVSQVTKSDGDGEANDATEAENTKYTKLAATPEASDGDGETNDDVKEQQESAKLQPLAKINAQQAKVAAETAQGNKASSVKLENEDGNLVYTVVIGKKEVTVDAGNAKVLYTEAANDETNEGSHPRSSIQVPKTPDRADGNGETNDDAKK
jgi:uncharacterized membrane protein YkoI